MRTVQRRRRAGVVATVAGLAAALALLTTPAAAQLTPPVTVPAPPTATRAAASAQAGDGLVGLFRLEAGECGEEGVDAGSWFRMVDPGGGHVENNDSPCDDDSWTPLAPGGDGGLRTGGYQPHPDPAFSGAGDARADRITEPQGFFGVDFATATNEVDPQTGTDVAPPAVTHDGAGKLGGDLRSFAAAWSGQHFNQGSPKPDGSRPGGTRGPEGTYDPDSGRFTLEWSSLIVGGPFNGFTGVWHFTGVFEPAASPAPSGPAASPPAGERPPAAAPSPGSAAAAPTSPGAGARAAGTSGLAGTGGTERTALAAALALTGIAGLAAGAAARRAERA